MQSSQSLCSLADEVDTVCGIFEPPSSKWISILGKLNMITLFVGRSCLSGHTFDSKAYGPWVGHVICVHWDNLRPRPVGGATLEDFLSVNQRLADAGLVPWDLIPAKSSTCERRFPPSFTHRFTTKPTLSGHAVACWERFITPTAVPTHCKPR